MNFRIQYALLLLSLLCVSTGRADNNICPLHSSEVNAMAFEKAAPIQRLSQNENRFFIGLYSNVTVENRKLLGQAMKETDIQKKQNQNT